MDVPRTVAVDGPTCTWHTMIQRASMKENWPYANSNNAASYHTWLSLLLLSLPTINRIIINKEPKVCVTYTKCSMVVNLPSFFQFLQSELSPLSYGLHGVQHWLKDLGILSNKEDKYCAISSRQTKISVYCQIKRTNTVPLAADNQRSRYTVK